MLRIVQDRVLLYENSKYEYDKCAEEKKKLEEGHLEVSESIKKGMSEWESIDVTVDGEQMNNKRVRMLTRFEKNFGVKTQVVSSMDVTGLF